MLTVKTATKKTENPFYGKRALLDMFQKVSKLGENPSESTIMSYFDKAYREASDRPSKELFYVMMFSFGDIANREHNVFTSYFGKNKVQAGGESLRKVFIYGLKWMMKNDPNQFYQFLPIIGEYTNLENPFYYQLRTDRKTGRLLEVLSIVPTNSEERANFIDVVSTFLVDKISSAKTSPATHAVLSKWLKTPNFSKRTRTYTKKDGRIVKKKRDLKAHTIEKERFEYALAEAISQKIGWEIVKYPSNTRFVGLEEYKSKHNQNSEAVMFSTKKVLEMDQAQFTSWLDKMPASARYRVQCRLFNKSGNSLVSTKKWVNKYGDLADFYNAWLNQKDEAAKVVRQLEDKANNSAGLTEKEKETLVKAKKDSKVNTGATVMLDVVAEFFSGNKNVTEVNVIAENLMRQMNMEVPVLVIADKSGSMESNYTTHKGVRFRALDMARLVATTFLLKNPDPELGQMFITFDDKADMIVAKNSSRLKDGGNRFMNERVTTVDYVTDRTKTFMENYNNISKYVYAGNSTELDCVALSMRNWVMSGSADEVEGRKEMINRYPVFLVVSDGDINNSGGATQSVQKFMMDMRQFFGWNGVLVIWDVKDGNASDEKNKFQGIENVMYFGKCNSQILTQIFSNIHDLDVIDVFEPIHALYKSNRYQPVKELVRS